MEDLTTEETNTDNDTLTDTGLGNYTEPPETTETTSVIELSEIGIDKLKALGKKQLAAICRAEDLPCSGKKSDLVNQLIAKKFGTSKRYVGSLTTCKVCAAGVMVKGTRTEPMDDGRVMVIRQIKCKGKNAHRYPLKECL